ncbi:putative chaperonin (GroES/Cpn10) [Aspergillus clavatus NRRL 1]|uniref:Chaperonin (GroES/Cpn10), putative n=1 Tax=Aspergillus clavatus (strain ATCC 1007 / CBS 513.65 / DSM 816 / NCTC 3887 / NRRL 1 / QM 1276 / 107) TaxID=344612 RepID=A1C4C0_ASPCL|nr:chaperonin (GroES/Cpn10), putative [Aspergillus clavatus NRRL 1]EAW15260.1 chaperonin (GroES/Cpn10), putative [Aspergillus clavatus NRRL 1]
MDAADAVHSYLCPQEDTIIIQPEEDITHFGTATKSAMKPVRGIVLAVGKTKALGKGRDPAVDVRLGDMVVYTKGKGKEVQVDKDKYLILKRDELSASLDDRGISTDRYLGLWRLQVDIMFDDLAGYDSF